MNWVTDAWDWAKGTGSDVFDFLSDVDDVLGDLVGDIQGTIEGIGDIFGGGRDNDIGDFSNIELTKPLTWPPWLMVGGAAAVIGTVVLVTRKK